MAAMSARLHPPSCCSPRGERLGHPFPDEVAMDRRIRSNMIHFLKNFRCARVLGAMRGEAARQARSPTQQRLVKEMSGIVPIHCTLPLFSGIYRDIDANFTELKSKRFKFSPGVGGRRAGSSGILCEKGHGRAARWGGAGLSFPCLSTKSAQILQCAATSAQY